MKKVHGSGFSRMARTAFVSVLLLAAAVGGISAQGKLDIYAQAEQGAIKLLQHTYRVGAVADGNDNFDFVHQGGQEILFFFERYTLGTTIAKKHDISFLYQPLEIVTNVKFKEAVQIDDVTFAAGSSMKLTGACAPGTPA